MDESQPIIVFHGRHFVRHLGICNPICVKLLRVMSGVIPRNLKNEVSISNRFPGVHKRGTHTQTDRRTHTTIAWGEMQCVEFRLQIILTALPVQFRGDAANGARYLLLKKFLGNRVSNVQKVQLKLHQSYQSVQHMLTFHSPSKTGLI